MYFQIHFQLCVYSFQCQLRTWKFCISIFFIASMIKWMLLYPIKRKRITLFKNIIHNSIRTAAMYWLIVFQIYMVKLISLYRPILTSLEVSVTMRSSKISKGPFRIPVRKWGHRKKTGLRRRLMKHVDFSRVTEREHFN